MRPSGLLHLHELRGRLAAGGGLCEGGAGKGEGGGGGRCGAPTGTLGGGGGGRGEGGGEGEGGGRGGGGRWLQMSAALGRRSREMKSSP